MLMGPSSAWVTCLGAGRWPLSLHPDAEVGQQQGQALPSKGWGSKAEQLQLCKAEATEPQGLGQFLAFPPRCEEKVALCGDALCAGLLIVCLTSSVNVCTSWQGLSLIWGRLTIRVASGLGDRELNSILYHLGNILTLPCILNHKWTGKDCNSIFIPLLALPPVIFVVEFSF